jgi:hypothetical protein
VNHQNNWPLADPEIAWAGPALEQEGGGGLSERPTLWRFSNYAKCNHLRAAPVPKVYLFDAVSTKTAGSRRFDDEPFVFACVGRIQSPCGEVLDLEAGANVARDLFFPANFRRRPRGEMPTGAPERKEGPFPQCP